MKGKRIIPFLHLHFERANMILQHVFKMLLILIPLLFCEHNVVGASTLMYLEDAERFPDVELSSIYLRKIYSYFNLKKYDTPLKRKSFEKTKEYKDLLDEIEKIREDLLSKKYYIKYKFDASEVQRYRFSAEGYSNFKNSFKWLYLSEYNLSKKAFVLSFVADEPVGFYLSEFEGIPNNVWVNAWGFVPDSVVFEPLPFWKESLKGRCHQKMLLPMDEESALEVENNIDKVEIYFVFKLGGDKKIKKINGYCETIKSEAWVLYVETVRFIMVTNSKVYIDKTHSLRQN